MRRLLKSRRGGASQVDSWVYHKTFFVEVFLKTDHYLYTLHCLLYPPVTRSSERPPINCTLLAAYARAKYTNILFVFGFLSAFFQEEKKKEIKTGDFALRRVNEPIEISSAASWKEGHRSSGVSSYTILSSW